MSTVSGFRFKIHAIALFEQEAEIQAFMQTLRHFNLNSFYNLYEEENVINLNNLYEEENYGVLY